MINLTTTLTGIANTQKRLTDWRIRLPKVVNVQMRRQALRLKTITVRGIRDGAPGGKAFKPLADSTIKMKGSSKPLIDNSDLIRSIDVDEVGPDQFFIGTNRNVETEDGEKMMNLAEIHENGTAPYFIPITVKMRRFWFVMVRKGVFSGPLSHDIDTILHPGVPARPYAEPSFNEWAKDFERQFTEGLARSLGLQRF